MTQNLTIEQRIRGGIIGLVTGDALGVPGEFKSRGTYHIDDMVGFGSHNQPAGTWSDDSSLALCTLHSLIGGYDPVDIMDGFSKWYHKGYMTAHGDVFDIGGATSDAILSYDRGNEPVNCGRTDVNANGNGSLMRILPASIYFHADEPADVITRSFEISRFTHGHIRSQLCCAYYSLLTKSILAEGDLMASLEFASREINGVVPAEEADILQRVLSGTILKEDESAISSSGYVVHTLEAAIWCCHTSDGFAEAVLEAVNLGQDTDTVGAVTGGIAGMLYGEQAIPAEWRRQLARYNDISTMTDFFIDAVLEKE